MTYIILYPTYDFTDFSRAYHFIISPFLPRLYLFIFTLRIRDSRTLDWPSCCCCCFHYYYYQSLSRKYAVSICKLHVFRGAGNRGRQVGSSGSSTEREATEFHAENLNLPLPLMPLAHRLFVQTEASNFPLSIYQPTKHYLPTHSLHPFFFYSDSRESKQRCRQIF